MRLLLKAIPQHRTGINKKHITRQSIGFIELRHSMLHKPMTFALAINLSAKLNFETNGN